MCLECTGPIQVKKRPPNENGDIIITWTHQHPRRDEDHQPDPHPDMASQYLVNRAVRRLTNTSLALRVGCPKDSLPFMMGPTVDALLDLMDWMFSAADRVHCPPANEGSTSAELMDELVADVEIPDSPEGLS